MEYKDKDCKTCAFLDSKGTVTTCDSCTGFSNWQPYTPPMISAQETSEYPLDCVKCGACCCAGFKIALTAKETKTLARFQENGAMKANNGICALLGGVLGKACYCRIYDKRPTICRAFTKGDKFCILAREWMGLEKPGASAEMRQLELRTGKPVGVTE